MLFSKSIVLHVMPIDRYAKWDTFSFNAQPWGAFEWRTGQKLVSVGIYSWVDQNVIRKMKNIKARAHDRGELISPH